MKAILEFNLPEESVEFELASHADMYWDLWEFYEHDLRGKLKYGHDFKTPDEALEWVQDNLREIVDSIKTVD